MPSAYLAVADLVAYGVPDATAAQIRSASALVDGYLKRPAGLQWMPDAAGLPCYMAGLSPVITLKSTQAIAAGQNVPVSVANSPGVMTRTGSVGDVVVLDRGAATKAEACVIASVSPGSVVLASVVNSHDAGATIDFGLVICEQRSMPAKRAITRVACTPISRVHSMTGSYRYGRRSDQNAGLYADQSLLAMMQTFGGPPEWFPIDVMEADFAPSSGEVWIPSGLYMATYSDVRLYYVAGYAQANIPSVIKSVTAAAILGGLATSDLQGGIKLAKAGDNMLQRFEASVVDDDMRQQLSMYCARMFV